MTSKLPRIDIDCIIPAAGLSSRMGEWKLMLPYQNSTIIEASVSNALKVCSRVIVVAGYRANELIERLTAYPNVTVVVNQHFALGMVSSIQLGVAQLRSDYFFISHGDLPCIPASIYQQLWQARSSGVLFPGDQQHSGHPVLIHSALKSAILAAPPTTSLKPILKQFPTAYLQLTNSDIHFDIDTPEAYQQLLSR